MLIFYLPARDEDPENGNCRIEMRRLANRKLATSNPEHKNAKNTRGVLIYGFWSLFLDPPTEINIFKLYFPTCWVEEAFFQPEVDDQQRQIGSRAGDPWMNFLSLDNYHYCLSLDYP